MGIEDFMSGKISPMETGKKDEGGEPILDMAKSEADLATDKLAINRSEEAQKSLEDELSKNKKPEEIRAEINDILSKL